MGQQVELMKYKFILILLDRGNTPVRMVSIFIFEFYSLCHFLDVDLFDYILYKNFDRLQFLEFYRTPLSIQIDLSCAVSCQSHLFLGYLVHPVTFPGIIPRAYWMLDIIPSCPTSFELSSKALLIF